ncbi:helicase [Mycobacterium phage Hawkeye]|uniref:Helicase n=1 Tax=Mycobacterium phage Hawkeye TaxID=1458711 RepID=X2KN82_9CAUD|nr:helicase [Mycobacterium phage Hawkeye]AHN84067.1 helicase [Mycobacterium phage Hawkeye]
MTNQRTWKIWIEENKIILQTDGYDPAVVENIKLYLPTPRSWRPSTKTWAVPLMWETCVALRQLANRHRADLKMSDELRHWAMAEKMRLAAIPDVNSHGLQPIPNIERQSPAMAEALKSRPFQTVGIKFATTARNVLIADHPGLGKTLQTIGAMVEADVKGPILVVAAPKSAAVITWPNELRQWVPGDLVYRISSSLTAQQRAEEVRKAAATATEMSKLYRRVWVVTSPNYVRFKADMDQYGNYVYEKGKKVISPVREAIPDLLDVEWSAIIVDESHKTLACGTGNRKKWSAQRVGLELLPLKKGGIRIALSGTPFRGKEDNAYGTLQWLRPDLYRGFWKWAERHFVIYGDGFSQIVGEVKDQDAFYDELKNVMIRRTKAEVVPDLPAKIYAGERLDPEDPASPVAVWLPMEGKQKTMYNEMVKNAAANLEGGMLTANGVLAELTRLKQMACSFGQRIDNADGTDGFLPALPSNKFDYLVDFLSDRGIGNGEFDPTCKVIVASQFTKLLNVFHDELAKLGIRAHLLTGNTPEKKRIAMQEEFQNTKIGDDTPHVFLLNTIAGGASITLDAADDVVTLDETWNKDDQEQVEDRAHRISRTDHVVTIYNLRSLGTIEERIATSAFAAERSIKSIIDGTRGVEFALQMLGES